MFRALLLGTERKTRRLRGHSGVKDTLVMLGRVGARTPAAGGSLLANQAIVQAQAVPLADVTPVLPTGVAPEPIERIDLRGLQGKWEATQSDMTNTPSMPCCALTGVERNVWTDSASGELTGFDKVNVRVCGCCWGSNYKYLAGRAGNTLCAAHHALHTPALACHLPMILPFCRGATAGPPVPHSLTRVTTAVHACPASQSMDGAPVD